MITVISYLINKKSNQKTNAFYAENNFTHPPTYKLTINELFEEIDCNSYIEVQCFSEKIPMLKEKVQGALKINSYITKNDYLQLYLNDLVSLYEDELKAYRNKHHHSYIENLNSNT